MSGDGVGVDDLQAFTDPHEQADITSALQTAPRRRKVAIVLAWLDLSETKWAFAAGINTTTVCRWISKVNRLPFGGALRLAKVIGLDPDLLFEDYRDHDAR